jgi:WD40 repeat protein
MESRHLRFPVNQQTLGSGLHLEVLGFSDHGSTLVVFDQLNAAVTFWSLTQSQNLTLPFSGLDSVGRALLSVDGRWLAIGEVDPKSQVIHLYDLLTKKVRNIAGQRPLSFSHDGRRLAVTTSQTSLQIVDTLAGTTQNRIGDLNDYTSAALTPTGSYLFVGTPEGTVLLYHLQTARKEATLSSEWIGTGWVVVAPNGLFDGSSSGMQDLLAWKFGPGMAGAGPIEMFLNEFYHPRLLSDVLAGKKARAPTRFELRDRRQPSLRLEILDPIPIQESRDSEPVLVRIQAQESPADEQHRRGSGVRDVRLFRNGSLVRLWRGNLSLNDRGEVVLEARVYITPGSNVLSCYAFNSDNIKSADTSITVEGPADKSPRGTAYVIAVGISRYSNHEYDLRYARDDAELLATELARAQQRTGLFADVKIIKLFDQDATRSNIQHTLNDLGEGPTRATPNDTVFLYFAGHGLATLSRYYLVPQDLNYSGQREMLSAADLKRVRAHSISDIELQRSLEQIDAGRIVLIIDACNSGQALKSPDIRLGPINTASFAQLAYEKGMYVLAASQSYQAAVESSRLGHGLLTYALIHDGLQNGSADFAPRDGVIGIQEWLNYAVMRVPELDFDICCAFARAVSPGAGSP